MLELQGTSPVTLPFETDVHPDALSATQPYQPITAPEPFTVLVVDDDEDSRLLLQYMLESFPCRLVFAADGQTALQTLQTMQPNLVLLDMLLPEISGFDIVRTLKCSPDTNTVPVVAVTAMAGTHDRERCLQAGCSGYFSKPFSIPAIQALVSQYLDLYLEELAYTSNA